MFHTNMALRKLVFAATIVLACAVPASAADAMTLSPGTPTLTDRVAITEPITVTCAPFEPSLTLTGENIFVQVEQAVGKTIAHGSSMIGSFSPTVLFPCDGSRTTIAININADPAGPPFHKGPAVFTETATAGAATPCFPGSTTCFTNPTASQSVNTGPISLKIG